MKILLARQIREIDRLTIKQEPVDSIDLMERACKAFVNWFILRFNESHVVGIVCGNGNNGGDGLGIARLLLERGYEVRVWIIPGNQPTEDFKMNLGRLKGKLQVNEITERCDAEVFSGCQVLIDALFGSGLSRPLEGLAAKTVGCMNSFDAVRISVDIPSGLRADEDSLGEIFKADYTVTFQAPKLSFLFPQSYPYTGEWAVVDIGLSKDAIKNAETDFYYILQKDVSRLVKKRKRFDHKGTFGHGLLIAGSFGKMGAAVLASRAALRTGLGLLTVHAPECGYNILQSSVPEAMVSPDVNSKHVTAFSEVDKYNAIGIGPGLGKHPDSVKAMTDLFAKFRRPMVIDADALNILSENKDLLSQIPEGSILTPHPKEFERLIGAWKNDFERLAKQRELAAHLKCVVVLKGAFTSITSPDGKVYFNSSGSPVLATGGTGDVLTGILTSLLTQSYESTEAAILGIYLHGMAADVCGTEMGDRGILASDLIEFIPNVYKKLTRK